MRRVTKSIEMSWEVSEAAERQARYDECDVSDYIRWLIIRDTQTLSHRGHENPLQVVNNTLQKLLDTNVLTRDDEMTALHTIDLVEEILWRIGDEDLREIFHLANRHFAKKEHDLGERRDDPHA